MKSEIWDEKKAQKAKTIVQYLIDNVKNVSVFIRLPIRTRFSFHKPWTIFFTHTIVT